MAGGALRFRTYAVARQQGELARVRVLQGPDQGAVYVITAPRVTLGRGEENDIILSDLKASRTHAELVLSQQGWVARDLGSANGITHNRHPARVAQLRSGEGFGLGETHFEFLASDQGTQVLTAPPKTLPQLQAEERAFEAQRARVQALGNVQFRVGQTKVGSQPKNQNTVYLAVGAAALAAYFYLQQPSKPGPSAQVSAQKKTESSAVSVRDLASYLPTERVADAPSDRTVEMFFREGLREYRVKNYLRARQQFENVLQIRPNEERARRYLENSKLALEDEVKQQMIAGNKNYKAGKLRFARGNFSAVLRLLARDQSDTRYREAEEILKKVEGEISSSRLPNLSDLSEGTP